MSTSMSAAQSAQQNNRGPGGQYSFGTHAEPENVGLAAPENQPIELEDGSDAELFEDNDGTVFRSIYLQRSGDEYGASGTPDNIDLAYLLKAKSDDGEVLPSFGQTMTRARTAATMDFIEQRYGNIQFIDSGADDHELPIEVYASYDHAPTEEKVVDDLWETGAKLANESDPGTFGSEYLGRLLTEHLDARVFGEPYPTKFSDGSWAGQEPPSGEEVLDDETRFLEDPTHIISDRSAMYLANHAGIWNADLKDFAKTGSMETERLILAADSVGSESIAAWARAQKPTSELLAAGHDQA